MSSFKARLALPYSMYITNPAETVRQILGQHITIESMTHSDLILPDDTIVVDVIYKAINISLFQIYFVQVSNLKPIIPDSDKYIVIINDCFVKVCVPNISSYPKVVPIKILATMPSKVGSNSGLETQCAYFGTIVTQPLNTICTPIRYINHSFEPFEVPPVKPIYPSTYISSIGAYNPSDSELNQMCRNYKASLILHNILNSVINVTPAKSYAECKEGTTGYVLPFSEIPITQDINGIILIQSKRIPNYVMFYPTASFTICVEELESLKSFIEQETINYYNFKYATEVLNSSKINNSE